MLQNTGEILSFFQRRLTNISPRNKSLVLLSLPKEQFLDLHELDFLQGQSSFHIIKGLIAAKNSLPLCQVLDSRSEKNNEISNQLRRISRTAQFIEAERGSEDLHIGWPIVQGKFTNGAVVRAPLLFWPVTLRNEKNHWYLEHRDEPLTINKSLLLAFSYYNQVSISDEILEMDFGEFSKDALVFRTQLYDWLKRTPLELNFNSDLFEDILTFFPRLNKPDLERLEHTGELKLYPQAILGIFPQAGSYLVRDYEKLLNIYSNTELFKYIQSANKWVDVKEADIFTCFPIDASQEASIRRVKSGESIVVQGPPGSGKSQLICNLIADYIARGKKVLVISQKRAALDTVYERIKQAGLTNFVANLHDFKHDRSTLYTQITTQIDLIDDYKRLDTSLDAILLDREYIKNARQIDMIQTELQNFKTALFDTKICGISAKELYLNSEPDGVNLDDIYLDFKLNEIDDFLQKLRRYEAYQIRLMGNDIWKDRVDFSKFSWSDFNTIKESIISIPSFRGQLVEQTELILKRQSNWQEIETFSEKIDFWKLSILSTNETVGQFVFRYDQVSRISSDFINKGIVTNNQSELQGLSLRLNKALQARSSFFSWILYTDKDYIRNETDKYGLSLDFSDLLKLNERLLNRIEAEEFLSQYGKQFGVLLLNEIWNISLQNWNNFANDIQKAIDLFKLIRKDKFSFELFEQSDSWDDYQNRIKKLICINDAFLAKNQEWLTFLKPSQINQILTHSNSNAFVADLERDFDIIQEADVLTSQFSREEREVISRLPEHHLADTFINSLSLAWLEHLERAYPILRSVSSLKMEQLETDLQQAIQRKQELASEIVMMQLRKQTYQSIETNRLGNVMTYRDLRHQVTKKRLIWPVRQVLTNYLTEIFQLIPCWLASPETVSAIFPLEEKPFFDLVIFDEASQCFAELGLPAMSRGKQVVIAGDSQQLQPSDLYRIRFEEDTKELPELEVNSLLEFAARFLPQTLLEGHYRSNSLDLIDFSNQHFYQNRLRLLPDYQEMNKRQPAIRYVKVEGLWQNQTNEAEAERIQKLINELTYSDPESSIGIVTFNYPQQRLLEEQVSVPENTFIKNLENVQGDERDIIIFSIGYAPDERGRITAQFGSLNQVGGENRLNVAITRARKRIYVVTSVWPEQLHVEDTSNEGPKLLKAYLEFARKVSDGQYQPKPRPQQGIQSSSLLKDQLKREHPNWVEEVPFADLVEKTDEHYLRLFLTDDDAFYQSDNPKEPHAYLPLSLKAKGWPYQRLWSREWWKRKAN
ncbi:MAG: AAA domain-containing protein [Siphonobacter sp.]